MGNSLRILVAEDDPPLAFALQFGLERAGFVVAVAHDGGEAWELLQRDTFDLLITDDQMPKMTGSELCRRLREDPHFAQLPVIMLTGKEPGREQLGWAEVIPKPFSPRKVVAMVKNRLLQGSVQSLHHAIGSARRFPYTVSPNAALSNLANSSRNIAQS
jgi:DNA-binding response OmpR family regulator